MDHTEFERLYAAVKDRGERSTTPEAAAAAAAEAEELVARLRREALDPLRAALDGGRLDDAAAVLRGWGS